MVARFVRDEEAGGSNPPTPTIILVFMGRNFCFSQLLDANAHIKELRACFLNIVDDPYPHCLAFIFEPTVFIDYMIDGYANFWVYYSGFDRVWKRSELVLHIKQIRSSEEVLLKAITLDVT